jgi:purine nucleosidase
VLAAGFELTMVPLDATGRAHADEGWMNAVAGYPGSRARFAARLVQHYARYYATALDLRGCLLHDPLAAAVLLDPALIVAEEERQVAMELNGSHTRGMTVTDRRPSAVGGDYSRRPVRIVLEADTQLMLDRMRDALTIIDPSPVAERAPAAGLR